MKVQISIVERAFNHRAATFATGAEATGAPSSSSGATKLYRPTTNVKPAVTELTTMAPIGPAPA
jgi:hypothetical protein